LTDRNQERLLTGAIIAAVTLVSWLSVIWFPAHAIDNGQWEGVDPQIRSWFNSVKSKNGVPCCSMADGHPTDFKVDEVGIYFVPIEGEWTRVPPEAVITSQGNPNDTAIVWWVRQGQSNGQPHYHVRCFVPVGGV
jgi:hypothetical protein